jgi:hypothetical protein
MPKGVPTAVRDCHIFPPTPISVIDDSNDGDYSDKVMECLYGYDSDGDDPAGKTSTPSDGTVIVSSDGNPIPAIQVATIVATDVGHNFCVKGDLDVQQDAKSAASNSRSSHVTGAMVPGSSVDRSASKSSHFPVDGSTSKSSHSSVNGSSSYTSVCPPPAVINHRQPSVSGTAGGNLPKCYRTSQIAEGGCAFPAQVRTVAQEVDDKVSCFFFLFLSLFLF